jgi:transmembrane sensor
MSGRDQTSADPTRDAAAAWVVRLRVSEAGEADWLAFEAWLAATSDARPAFDDAMALWLLSDQLGSETIEPVLGDRRSRDAPAGARSWGAASLGLGGLAAAISAALILTLRPGGPQPVPGAGAPVVYATAIGERRSVTLADGSQLDLSGGSRVTVDLQPRTRRLSMSAGEVAFTVVHDARRPFVVAVGDRQVRDLGTEFDILRSGSRIDVTVRQGQVEVAAPDVANAPPVALGAGRQWLHDEDTGATSVQDVVPDEVFAWKQGRLIYRDQPLRVVVEDLNRYFPHAVKIDDERVAALRFTGVLAVDGEEATIRRLVALLPISATREGDATVLRARDEGHGQ